MNSMKIWRVIFLPFLAFLAFGVVFLLAGCGQSKAEQEGRGAASPEYAVTTSWLECCLRDLLGAQTPVLRVCPPGTCPGHFDLSPGTYKGLRQCRALFLFDFQSSLGERLDSMGSAKPRIAPIPAPEGLCVPANYLAGCRSARDALAAGGGSGAGDASRGAALDAALARIETRLDALESGVREKIRAARLEKTRVVASGHQAVFCQWLGLEVAASYSGGSESASPARLERLIEEGRAAQVRFVIANLQEGRQMGEALAHPLGARLVIFSNFPTMTPGQDTFDALVEANVDALVEAARAESASETEAMAPKSKSGT